MNKQFEVNFDNGILGNGSYKMTLDEIKKFNLVAFALAKKAEKEPGRHFYDGMWSVRTA